MPGPKTILPEVTAGSKPAILVRMYHTCILTFVQSWPYQIQPNSFSSSAAREHAAVAWGSCSSTPIPPWFPEGLGPQRENVRLLMTSKNVSEIYGSSPRKNRQSQEETHLPTIISSGASCLNFRGCMVVLLSKKWIRWAKVICWSRAHRIAISDMSFATQKLSQIWTSTFFEDTTHLIWAYYGLFMLICFFVFSMASSLFYIY